MNSKARYEGNEPCVNIGQVVSYLMDNYVDVSGNPMQRGAALLIVEASFDKITKGIEAFRSNVYYLGDEAIKGRGWKPVMDPDEDGSNA
jgi:hypothetical protein